MSNISKYDSKPNTSQTAQEVPTRDLPKLLEFVARELEDGLRHGFFQLTVDCELTKNRKRQVTVAMAHTHRFVIAEDEL